MISFVLRDAVGIKNGITLEELTLVLFHKEFPEDPDKIDEDQYLAKEKKVVRAINLIKKMTLEGLAKFFGTFKSKSKEQRETDIVDIPFCVCSAYSEELKTDVFFNYLGRDKSNVEELIYQKRR